MLHFWPSFESSTQALLHKMLDKMLCNQRGYYMQSYTKSCSQNIGAELLSITVQWACLDLLILLTNIYWVSMIYQAIFQKPYKAVKKTEGKKKKTLTAYSWHCNGWPYPFTELTYSKKLFVYMLVMRTWERYKSKL